MLPDPIRPAVFRIISDYGTEEIFDMPQQLVSITGLGMPSVNNYTVEAPFQDGETWTGYALRGRLLQVAFHLRHLWGPASLLEEQATRQRLLGILNPALAPFTFQMDMSNGDSYQLRDVFYEAGFEAGIDYGQGELAAQRVAVRLRCADPVWWGEEHTVTFPVPPLAAVEPTEIYGNYYSYPEIELVGGMTNVLLEIVEYDVTMPGYAPRSRIGIADAIPPGERAYITTAHGERRAVNEDGENLGLTATTTLSTFRFIPHPIKTLHDLQDVPLWYNNIFRILAVSTSVDSEIIVRYNDRWIGI